MALLDVIPTFGLPTLLRSDARVEFTTEGGQASLWLNAMAERTHRERDSRHCERQSDHREAEGVAV